MQTTIREQWQAGYGVVRHRDETVVQLTALLQQLVADGRLRDLDSGWRLLHAADRLASMGMWLVVHMSYARRIRLDGSPLAADDFKQNPEGHTGGALNMVPAYVGYLLANALSGDTRAWIMEQGHCVAAIDAVNLLVGNAGDEHASRYPLDDAGLTRLVNDFYHCGVGADGRPVSPLGSHVNAYTGGGLMEGGYLGFAGLQYVHMPLPGQRLVAFLSDGAFEEQRGPDWASRWWRSEDCGLVAPIMIANGRRIDQRTTLNQSGGVDWLYDHLRLNGFEPLLIDGRDPAAFAWAILTQEAHLQRYGEQVRNGERGYPVPLPYAIAETVKGYGFPGAGSNRAHNLPLPGNPSRDAESARQFNEGAAQLYVAPQALAKACAALANHETQRRPRERDNPLVTFRVDDPAMPELPWQLAGERRSPMAAIDTLFAAMVRANPQLRVRVGNPDEMRSNRLNATLDLLGHRVTAPEPGIAESIHGGVITALNEEAVACAALANKQGLNLVASYEAFAVKMLGSLRQEIIFARHCREIGREPGWLSVPILLSSHTWENGKNEQSHQDPTLAEALLGEMSDAAPVLFPVDGNSAIAALQAVYRSRGRIAGMVVPKAELPEQLTPEQAQQLVAEAALCLEPAPADAPQLIAIGAYQLIEARRAWQRLRERGVACALWVVIEPGRLRDPRDSLEADYIGTPRLPPAAARLFFSHTRPEPLLGALRPLDLGPQRCAALGYRNRGGTLDTFGMLYANGCTWAHGLLQLARLLQQPAVSWLDADELAAVEGRGDPERLR
jgi:phosphoketolase